MKTSKVLRNKRGANKALGRPLLFVLLYKQGEKHNI